MQIQCNFLQGSAPAAGQEFLLDPVVYIGLCVQLWLFLYYLINTFLRYRALPLSIPLSNSQQAH